MRNRQMQFAAVNRIYILLYAPLSAALAIFYLFTANLTDAVLSLLTIPCILLPFAVQKLFKLRRSQLLLFFYLLFLTLYYSGELVVRIPQRFSAYSALTHLYSGIFFAIMGIITFSMLQKERPKNHDVLFCNIFSLSMAVASNAMLELLNILVQTYVLGHVIPIFAIAVNFGACIAGAVLLCILSFLNRSRGIHTYVLYAVEDFTALNIPISVKFAEK